MALRGNLNCYAEQSTDDSDDCYDIDMSDEEIPKEHSMRYSHTGKVPSMNSRKTSRYIQSPVDNMFEEPADINEEDITRQVKYTTSTTRVRSPQQQQNITWDILAKVIKEQQKQLDDIQDWKEHTQADMEKNVQELQEKVHKMEEENLKAAQDAERAENEEKAKLEKFLEDGSAMLQGELVEVSNIIDLVRKHNPEVKKVDKESLQKFDTAKQDFDVSWLDFKRFCDDSVSTLNSEMKSVENSKKEHDDATIHYSGAGVAASCLTLAPMLIPGIGPLALVGTIAGAYSAIGGSLQDISYIQWQTKVNTTVNATWRDWQQKETDLNEKCKNIAQCFRDLLHKIEAETKKRNRDSMVRGQASNMQPTTYLPKYQVDKRVRHLGNQFVKLGSHVAVGVVEAVSLDKVTVPVQSTCNKMVSQESVNATAKLQQGRFVMHDSQRYGVVNMGQQLKKQIGSQSSGMVKKSQHVTEKMQQESMKAVRNGSNVGKVVKFVGVGLTVYSLLADINEIYKTKKGMECEHKLYIVIQNLIKEIKDVKGRSPCIQFEKENRA